MTIPMKRLKIRNDATQDVGDVEQQRPVRELLAARDVHREVLERQQHEHRHHRLADVLEVGRVVVVEDDPADHPVDVDEQQRDRRQARDAGDRAADRDGEHAQVGQQPDRAHDPQQPHEPQQRRVLAHARHEARRDDDEVEDVPAAAEEVARAVGEGGHAQDELDDEEPEDDRRWRGAARARSRRRSSRRSPGPSVTALTAMIESISGSNHDDSTTRPQAAAIRARRVTPRSLRAPPAARARRWRRAPRR